MSLEARGKRRRADVEASESQQNASGSDEAELVRSKRMRGVDGRLWEPALATPPTTNEPSQRDTHHGHVDSRWQLNNRQTYSASNLLATPAHSPPTGAEAEDEWEDSGLDPSSQYYTINRLLNQLHHEREQRRQH
ncbi:hypothetical protein IWW40_003154 [Coemansia sp. RSA 1250]|nr:hypothetical protein IWW40_003154 [Coemansia sp. RSA 1250]